jgi:hypothetical protein
VSEAPLEGDSYEIVLEKERDTRFKIHVTVFFVNGHTDSIDIRSTLFFDRPFSTIPSNPTTITSAAFKLHLMIVPAAAATMRPDPSLSVALRRHATVLLCLAVAAVAWRPAPTTERRMTTGAYGYHSVPLAPAASLSKTLSSLSAQRRSRPFRAVVASAVEASIDNGADATSTALDYGDDVCPVDEDELERQHAALRSEVGWTMEQLSFVSVYWKISPPGGRELTSEEPSR